MCHRPQETFQGHERSFSFSWFMCAISVGCLFWSASRDPLVRSWWSRHQPVSVQFGLEVCYQFPEHLIYSTEPTGWGSLHDPAIILCQSIPKVMVLQALLPKCPHLTLSKEGCLQSVDWVFKPSARTLAALGFIALVDEDADFFKDENRTLKVNQWVFDLDNNKEISSLSRKEEKGISGIHDLQYWRLNPGSLAYLLSTGPLKYTLKTFILFYFINYIIPYLLYIDTFETGSYKVI